VCFKGPDILSVGLICFYHIVWQR